MSRLHLIVILIICSLTSRAQELGVDSVKKSKIAYYFQVQSGAIIGCNSCRGSEEIGFSGATIHGVKFGQKLRVGGGIGLDSYSYWNTVPVFGSINYDLIGKKKSALFIEANVGDALLSRRKPIYEEYGYKDSKGGMMYSYGLGYKFKYDQMRISLGVGRKTQMITYYYEYPTLVWRNGTMVAGDPSQKIVKTEINRLMIWMAVGWK